uniref:Uncharacterized protein n=1 Tax=Panagrolaimus davidi TaxID=227884 RepID=A0A914QWN6_9BILA
MDAYIFDKPTFNKLYKCSNAQNLSDFRDPSPILGYVFISCFVIFEVLYLPLLFVLALPFYRSKSCYQLMYAITWIDIFTMPINGGLTGYFFIKGSTYCDFPMTILFAGAFGNVFWMGQSFLTVTLALNRCLSMVSPYFGDILFSGKRTFIWIGIDICYMITLFFTTKSIFFNAAGGAWFFTPFLGYDYDNYRNWIHFAHNTCIPIFLALFYLIFALSILKKRLISAQQPQVLHVMYSEAALFLPVFIISVVVFCGALVYDYTQFFAIPTVMVKAASFSWLFVHGFPSVLFLVTHKQIRGDYFQIMGINFFMPRLRTITQA